MYIHTYIHTYREKEFVFESILRQDAFLLVEFEHFENEVFKQEVRAFMFHAQGRVRGPPQDVAQGL
jgi:hypothetical protein